MAKRLERKKRSKLMEIT